MGKSGLGGEDDWTLKEGGEDDGEKGASAVVKECLKESGSVDVGVVVSRLYGGTSLCFLSFFPLTLP
jgi:putative IMPACT (imprinted ancient) family translation regulator